MNKFSVCVGLVLSLLAPAVHAEETEGKRYNFGVRPHPLVEEVPAEDVKKDEPKVEPPVAEQPKEAPAQASAIVNGVYSPKGSAAAPSEHTPKATTHTHPSKGQQAAENSKKAEELVRFFMGSCLKYYGRNKEMVEYMDAAFPRLETERKADFAPVIGGNINTQYWDVVRGDAFYMLAKDTSSGKCDLIAKDGASTAVHKELKAVMDGLTITKILETKTEYERVPSKNKEVSMVNILGHPLEKELAIVATTKIKDTGDNIAAQLTLFTVPQETVDVIDVTPKEAPTQPSEAGGGFSKE